MKLKRFTINVRPDLHALANEYAKSKGVSVADLIRYLLADHLGKPELSADYPERGKYDRKK